MILFHLKARPAHAAVAMLLLTLSQSSPAAQTLEQGIRNALNSFCPVQFPPPQPDNLGPNLDLYCTFRNSLLLIPGGPEGAAGSGTRQSNRPGYPEAIRERLDEDQEGSAATLYREGGLALFANLEYEELDKDITPFEPGFDSSSNSGIIGMDYRVSNALLIGAAGQIRRTDGDFTQSGGNFDVDTWELFLFGSYLPTQRIAVEWLLGYADHDFETKRRSVFVDPDSRSPLFEDAFVFSDTEGDEFEASLRAAYHLDAGPFTLTPSVGMEYWKREVDGYGERGDAALRLAYPERTEESLTSILGLSASRAVSLSWGVLVPQAHVEWVHEYRRDARDIRAHFAEDFNASPTQVVYSTEAPDRDYFHLDLGLSLLLPGGIQSFVNYRTMFGHDYYDNHIVTLGIRAPL